MVPALPSASVTSETRRLGAGSSSLIVPTAEEADERIALVGAVRVILNVSASSLSALPRTAMLIVPVAEPAGIVRIPLAAT